MESIQMRGDSLLGKNTRFITAAVGGLVAMALPGMVGTALADPPVAMAPPVASTNSATSSSNDVFQWTEIPENEQVPLTRAVFDQGGYQLYDTEGETVVVPFADKNLYVMKFAVSPNDTLYFVNENGTPVLYVPRNGYLENASVAGAKWYPFSEQFTPTQPVYLGVAPSYTEFIDTGWYPSTVIYGGYYCPTSFIAGGVFRPTLGLTFFIGGHPYHGWHEYHNYVIVHPAPYHIRYANAPIYQVHRPYHEFHGYTNYREHRIATGHVFHGTASHPIITRPTGATHFGGGNFDRGHVSVPHVFQGAAPRFSNSAPTFHSVNRPNVNIGHSNMPNGHMGMPSGRVNTPTGHFGTPMRQGNMPSGQVFHGMQGRGSGGNHTFTGGGARSFPSGTPSRGGDVARGHRGRN